MRVRIDKLRDRFEEPPLWLSSNSSELGEGQTDDANGDERRHDECEDRVQLVRNRRRSGVILIFVLNIPHGHGIHTRQDTKLNHLEQSVEHVAPDGSRAFGRFLNRHGHSPQRHSHHH